MPGNISGDLEATRETKCRGVVVRKRCSDEGTKTYVESLTGAYLVIVVRVIEKTETGMAELTVRGLSCCSGGKLSFEVFADVLGLLFKT